MVSFRRDHYCFLLERYCDSQTDCETPSCFISIPFKLTDEIRFIKKTLERYKIRPLIADRKPPTFLFRNICELISKAMIGIFEVTRTNEGVFQEYGIMLEQGKPAILMYDQKRRRKELHSNFKGLLQTRYSGKRSLASKLSQTLLTLPKNMRPRDKAILGSYLFAYRFYNKFKHRIRKSDYKIELVNYEIKKKDENESSTIFGVSVNLKLRKEGNLFELAVLVDIEAFKEGTAILVNAINANMLGGKAARGKDFNEEKEKAKPVIINIAGDSLKELDQELKKEA